MEATGEISQALEECGIVINMNKLPYDERNAFVTSGMRLGTPIVTKCGMGAREMDVISLLIDRVLRAVEITGEKEYRLDEDLAGETREAVRGLCREFPVA